LAARNAILRPLFAEDSTMSTTRSEVAHALQKAGLKVPDDEVGQVTEGVEILERIAAKLRDRDPDLSEPGAVSS
jgi:hypothetical protein